MIHQLNRRTFLHTAAAPWFIPAAALGRSDRPAPSDRITVGCIGVGWQGEGNLNSFLNQPNAHVLAVSDVDRNHLQNARNRVNNHYHNNDCATYHDFQDLLARDDIDALCLSLPDHWHAVAAIAAARAGKDIYAEKPLAHSFAEGLAIVNAVERYGRIWQTGSWQRSFSNFRLACQIVRNGRIGRVRRVEVGLPAGHSDFANTKGQDAITPPPEHLDWDRWLGPARYQPYRVSCVHKNWRWVYNTGGGQLMDWIGHHLDIAHWGLDFDHTGPLSVHATGEAPPDGPWNTATKYRVTCQYPNDIEIILGGGYPDSPRGGTKWIGDDGWVWVDRSDQLETHPADLKTAPFTPNDLRLYRSDDHTANFLDCVRSRKPTITPCRTAHHSVAPGHLALISMTLNRPINFDPASQTIPNDPAATALLSRPQRPPWRL